MPLPVGWDAASDPAHLFLLLWRHVNGARRDVTSAACDMPNPFGDAAKAALREDGGAAAVASLCDLLAPLWQDNAPFRTPRIQLCYALGIMRAIDMAMFAIHPRSMLSGHRQVDLPEWLEDIREKRTLGGTYAQSDELSLIARGPFMRSARMPLDDATFTLANQFAALKVFRAVEFNEDDRPVRIKVQVIDHSGDLGVPHRRDRAANEIISFVPLAEAGDLAFRITQDDASTYIDIEKCAKFDPAAKFLDAVLACSQSDILIAPELTVGQDDVRVIASGLGAMNGPRARLLVTGSGHAQCDDADAPPYNQASILNGKAPCYGSIGRCQPMTCVKTHSRASRSATFPTGLTR